MDFSAAPLFTDVSPGPEDGRAFWLETSDGVRVRVGLWGRASDKGTVLLLPGRTEYVEKYGPTAAEFATRGFATFAIDWRGQGLADRLLEPPLDPRIGHVERYTDYQRDFAAMVRAAHALDLPKPWFMLAHSMSGATGLRALIEGAPVRAAAFTGPMWGINLSIPMQVFAALLTRVLPTIGQGHRLAPTTKIVPYPLAEPFHDNVLTRDEAMYRMMGMQLTAHPELMVGGPSVTWVGEALRECAALSRRASPDVPCLAICGSNERITDIPAMEKRMSSWPGGRLEMIEAAEHEVLMEVPKSRARVLDLIAEHFSTSP